MSSATTPKTPVLRVTDRDLDVLDALGDHRFLSIPQLTCLFFASRGSAETRLRKLFEHDLAVRVFMPVRPYSRSAHTIYALSACGAKLLAPRHNGVRPRHLPPHEQRSGLFLDHTLRRNDLRICLILLARSRSTFTLRYWKQAVDEVKDRIWVQPRNGKGALVTMIPDGVSEIRYQSLSSAFAVEIDMGTVPVKKMADRYRAYATWWRRGGAHVRHPAVPFRLLTLAPDERRCDALRRAAIAASGSPKGLGLFWFTTLDNADIADPGKLLRQVWTTARAGKPAKHFLLADHEVW